MWGSRFPAFLTLIAHPPKPPLFPVEYCNLIPVRWKGRSDKYGPPQKRIPPPNHIKSIRRKAGILREKLDVMIREKDAVGVRKCDLAICRNNRTDWCSFPVKVPLKPWSRMFNMRPHLLKKSEQSNRRVKVALPGNAKIVHARGRAAVDAAMEDLRTSMIDPVICIDFEWSRPHQKIGLLQLASANTALLIRGVKYWKMDKLPPPLLDLFSEPFTVVVGYGWSSVDESKMQKTFGGFGRLDFRNFVDLQKVAYDMGYGPRIGLGTLTKKVLGVGLPNDVTITTTDWHAKSLSHSQMLYAGMDVFAIGQVFRQLRFWHNHMGFACPVCQFDLGKLFPYHRVSCADCSQSFDDAKLYSDHCKEMGHSFTDPTCSGCGRIVAHDALKRANTVQKLAAAV